MKLERPPNEHDQHAISTRAGRSCTGTIWVSRYRRSCDRGGPKIFAAGADIKEFPAIQDKAEAIEFSLHLHQALLAIENLPQVTISAVNGYALGGGCELAMSTDFRFAGEGAVFGQPEVLLGILPGAGGTQRLMRLVGITKAKEINYSGRQVKAEEAQAIGLVSEVFADEECYPKAIEAAEVCPRP